MNLTPRKKKIISFIKNYTKQKGFSPSIPEISKHFKLAISTVHQHLEELEASHYLNREKNRRRSIGLSQIERVVSIPLLGTIVAGKPLDTNAQNDGENVNILSSQLPKKYIQGSLFALNVSGESMIEDGILDGDIIIAQSQKTAENGETVVALVNGTETTLKKFYKEKNRIKLQPANPKFQPIFSTDVQIQGKFLTMIRKAEGNSSDTEGVQLTPATLSYIKNTRLDHRKSLGQFFTPLSIREKLLSYLPKSLSPIEILDPACGTGEFLISAKKYFPNARIHGWEIDRELIDIAQKLNPKAILSHGDALLRNEYGKFDVVVGNPPYFEFKPNEAVSSKFKGVIGGRPNIFGLFIAHGLNLLKPGGYLAFVVPPSMNNGAYFAKLRTFITENSRIEKMEILKNPRLFTDALQSTMLLVLRKGMSNDKYILRQNGITIFSENYLNLRKEFEKAQTLKNLGYTVRTGKIIWNENRQRLTHLSHEGVPLIWAHNIHEASFSLNIPLIKQNKPQYIRGENHSVGPAIVVNRITGSVSSTRLRAGIIPAGMKFFAENHVNVIFPPKHKQDIASLHAIAKQISSPAKANIMKSITGNTQVSKTELENLFPITI